MSCRRFFGSKFNHSVEELLVSPTPNYVILMGYVVGGVTRGLLVAMIVTCVSCSLPDCRFTAVAVVVSGVILTSVLFALAGFINAVFANSFDDISIIPTFVLTPLIYLGRVFYSLDLLPDFWAAVSKLNPLVYVVNAFRYGVLGVADVSVGFAFAMLGGFTVVCVSAYSMYLLNSGTRLRQ
jgi:ABC-2 type transport system permease protein